MPGYLDNYLTEAVRAGALHGLGLLLNSLAIKDKCSSIDFSLTHYTSKDKCFSIDFSLTHYTTKDKYFHINAQSFQPKASVSI